MLIRQLRNTIESLEASRNHSVVVHGRYILHTLDTLISSSKILTWAETDENDAVTLCCCPKNVGREMYKYLWSNGHHHILTSGTMSDGRSFEYFEKESGVDRVRKDRKQYSSTLSPFDYAGNTRLYLPEDLPMPSDASDEKYVSAIAERITELVKVTHGHTAILFTSYRMLNAVYEKVKDRISGYELIRMTRSNRNAIRDFKKKDNVVLFASGSMWEGVDCAGDKLSSVIIVRLPFPLRSAAMEEKKSASANVSAFINEYAVPEMLIKLRQGVGRLIRCETDTGLISVLDTRAVRSRYSERVQAVLSKYPRVENLDEIREFFHSVKHKEYFEE
ncbi:MAG: ATP-dependent DNA helicase [Candidatus Flemingiibacterium sp.]